MTQQRASNVERTTRFLMSIDSGRLELGKLLTICLKHRPMSFFDALVEMAQISTASSNRTSRRVLHIIELTFDGTLCALLSAGDVDTRGCDGILRAASYAFILVALLEQGRGTIDDSTRETNAAGHLSNAVEAASQGLVCR